MEEDEAMAADIVCQGSVREGGMAIGEGGVSRVEDGCWDSDVEVGVSREGEADKIPGVPGVSEEGRVDDGAWLLAKLLFDITTEPLRRGWPQIEFVVGCVLRLLWFETYWPNDMGRFADGGESDLGVELA